MLGWPRCCAGTASVLQLAARAGCGCIEAACGPMSGATGWALHGQRVLSCSWCDFVRCAERCTLKAGRQPHPTRPSSLCQQKGCAWRLKLGSAANCFVRMRDSSNFGPLNVA